MMQITQFVCRGGEIVRELEALLNQAGKFGATAIFRVSTEKNQLYNLFLGGGTVVLVEGHFRVKN